MNLHICIVEFKASVGSRRFCIVDEFCKAKHQDKPRRRVVAHRDKPSKPKPKGIPKHCDTTMPLSYPSLAFVLNDPRFAPKDEFVGMVRG